MAAVLARIPDEIWHEILDHALDSSIFHRGCSTSFKEYMEAFRNVEATISTLGQTRRTLKLVCQLWRSFASKPKYAGRVVIIPEDLEKPDSADRYKHAEYLVFKRMSDVWYNPTLPAEHYEKRRCLEVEVPLMHQNMSYAVLHDVMFARNCGRVSRQTLLRARPLQKPLTDLGRATDCLVDNEWFVVLRRT